MIWAYRLLFLPGLLASLPYYLMRMLRRGGYGTDFSHRFGRYKGCPQKAPGTRRIWIQAVSVGEVNAIIPLVERLAMQPRTEVIVTTTTSTGYRVLKNRLRQYTVFTGHFPIDWLPFSRAAWKAFSPDLMVLMECELWPEHLHQAKHREVPVFLLNARMSDRSFQRYQKVPKLAKRLLDKLQAVLATSTDDAERFAALGVPPSRLSQIGSLKLDVSIQPWLEPEEREEIKAQLGLLTHFTANGETGALQPIILLGSSTWPGEEAMLVQLTEKLLKEGVNCRLLLVPRHAERREEIRKLLEKQGRAFHFRSDGPPPGPLRIYVADTTGELALLSQLADIAYIGKSMRPNEGGQTPIEAAAIGLPILYGPNMNNFREVCRQLEAVGAAKQAKTPTELATLVLTLIQRNEIREKMSQAAKTWHSNNQGATQRALEALNE